MAMAVSGMTVSSAFGQVIAQKIDTSGLTLPANTLVYVSLNDNLTSKRHEEGEVFDMTVTRPVISGDYVVIPAGTLAHGRISWRTGKAVFGKSAKMDIEMLDLEVGNTTVPLTGHYHFEGKGNTGWTIGAVAAFGLWGGLVTGKSAGAAQGTEFKAFTRAPVGFSLADRDSQLAATGVAPVSLSGRGTNLSPYEAGRRQAKIQMSAAGIGPSIDIQ